MDMRKAFTAGFNKADYNAGGCYGGLMAEKFMQAPYVMKTAGWVEVNNMARAVNDNTCIYQDTQETCSFSVSGDDLT